MIYEEFKGTGNMEIHLNRNLSEKRIFPAIDIQRSGTRKEELLYNQEELEAVWTWRKASDSSSMQEVTEQFTAQLVKTDSNQDWIEWIKKYLKSNQ